MLVVDENNEIDDLTLYALGLLSKDNIDTVYDRLAKYKAEGAIGIGELMINKKINSPFLEELLQKYPNLPEKCTESI